MYYMRFNEVYISLNLFNTHHTLNYKEVRKNLDH
jgi:hypothetical protein